MTPETEKRVAGLLNDHIPPLVGRLLDEGVAPRDAASAVLNSVLGACLGVGFSIVEIRALVDKVLSHPMAIETEQIIRSGPADAEGLRALKAGAIGHLPKGQGEFAASEIDRIEKAASARAIDKLVEDVFSSGGKRKAEA